MEIKRRRVQYGDTVEKGTVWGYSGDGYSRGSGTPLTESHVNLFSPYMVIIECQLLHV